MFPHLCVASLEGKRNIEIGLSWQRFPSSIDSIIVPAAVEASGRGLAGPAVSGMALQANQLLPGSEHQPLPNVSCGPRYRTS